MGVAKRSCERRVASLFLAAAMTWPSCCGPARGQGKSGGDTANDLPYIEQGSFGHQTNGMTHGVRVSGEDYERARWSGSEALGFEIVVDSDGSVLSAKPLEDDPDHGTEMLAYEMTQKYKPWFRDGEPIRVRVRDAVFMFPPADWGQGKLNFPAQWDLKDVKLGLWKGGCFGTCPIYRLTITGDGSVMFEGRKYVKELGARRLQISPEAVRGLVEEFRSVAFFSARDSYPQNIDDAEQMLTLTVGGQTKTVTGGSYMGLPEPLLALEKKMNEVAGTQLWVERPPPAARKPAPVPNLGSGPAR